MATESELEYFLSVRDAALDFLDDASHGELKRGYYNAAHDPVYKDGTKLAVVGLGKPMRMTLDGGLNERMADKFSKWAPVSTTDMGGAELIGNFIVMTCNHASAPIFGEWIGIKVGS